MPGKVNPTQCEALTMVCAQVIGNDAAGRHRRQPGQLRAQRLQAGDDPQRAAVDRGCSPTPATSFDDNCVAGIEPEPRAHRRSCCTSSLMLVTALNPHIGYDNAAKVAKKAYEEGTHPGRGGQRGSQRQTRHLPAARRESTATCRGVVRLGAGSPSIHGVIRTNDSGLVHIRKTPAATTRAGAGFGYGIGCHGVANLRYRSWYRPHLMRARANFGTGSWPKY